VFFFYDTGCLLRPPGSYNSWTLFLENFQEDLERTSLVTQRRRREKKLAHREGER
jgi:hypothetical protein